MFEEIGHSAIARNMVPDFIIWKADNSESPKNENTNRNYNRASIAAPLEKSKEEEDDEGTNERTKSGDSLASFTSLIEESSEAEQNQAYGYLYDRKGSRSRFHEQIFENQKVIKNLALSVFNTNPFSVSRASTALRRWSEYIQPFSMKSVYMRCTGNIYEDQTNNSIIDNSESTNNNNVERDFSLSERFILIPSLCGFVGQCRNDIHEIHEGQAKVFYDPLLQRWVIWWTCCGTAQIYNCDEQDM